MGVDFAKRKPGTAVTFLALEHERLAKAEASIDPTSVISDT